MGQPRSRSRCAHLVHSAQPLFALAADEGPQRRGVDVDEITEDVNVASARHGADLDAGNQLDAGVNAPPRGRPANAGRGVVIGDADERRGPRRGPRETSSDGASSAVGGGGMEVKIDQDSA